MTLADLKHLAEEVLHLPEDTAALYSVATYAKAMPLHSELGRVLSEVRDNIPAEERSIFELTLRAACGGRSRKHSGTGSYDTPEDVWREMRPANLAGESLMSLRQAIRSDLLGDHQSPLRRSPARDAMA